MPVEQPPILIYDGECGFCRYWVARWKARTRERVRYAPYQEVGDRYPEIGRPGFTSAVWFVDRDGTVLSGAAAVFRALEHAPLGGWLALAHRRIPGFASASERVYRFVARNRGRFSTWTRYLRGPVDHPSTYSLSRWIFLRLLGVVFLLAFVSLWTQILGLVGDAGILPAGPTFQAALERLGPEVYYRFPTIFWWHPTEAMLTFLCFGGVVLSLLLILAVAPVPNLILLWAFYLSLMTVCRVFLRFQWDNLLLETAFLAVFLAPGGWRPVRNREAGPSPVAVWMIRWLLFRLMFQSGVVKLRSDDPTWRDWTALQYHYETQPLPTWVGWWAHQLPAWAQKASAGAMFFIELVVPFLIFAPRRIRHWACGCLVFFQLTILATGNYGYFNLLTVALCLLLLDDTFWWKRFPARLRDRLRKPGFRPREGWIRRAAVGIALLLVLLVTGTQTLLLFREIPDLPGPVVAVFQWTGPFRTLNRYGLFAVMTTTRREIQIEGSLDGRAWRPYAFRWKPGDPDRRPRFVAPHMPRLDWQMWFAALSSYRNHPWLQAFMHRLLEGSPEVLGLLRENPFPDEPPRYLRAVVYDYRFTDPSTWWREGAWWRRERQSLYAPVLSRDPDGTSGPAGRWWRHDSNFIPAVRAAGGQSWHGKVE